MPSGTPATPPSRGGKPWLSIAILAILATGTGMVLPQFLGGGRLKPDSVAIPGPLDSLTYTPPTLPDGPDPRTLLFKLTLGTLFVLALAVATLLLGRRWLQRLAGGATPSGRMRLVESLALGNRCVIHLVEIGRQQIVVGADGGGVKSMVTLPNHFEETLAEAEKGAPPLSAYVPPEDTEAA